MSTSLISGTGDFTFIICGKVAKKTKLISLFYSNLDKMAILISATFWVKSIHKSGTPCKIQKDMASRSVSFHKHIKFPMENIVLLNLFQPSNPLMTFLNCFYFKFRTAI